MTKEEWAKAEKVLKSFYPPVYLKIDEYDIALRLERISTYKNAIGVYIGGVFKGSWMLEDSKNAAAFSRKRCDLFFLLRERPNSKGCPRKSRKRLQKSSIPNMNITCLTGRPSLN